jgi:hypothetical protein
MRGNDADLTVLVTLQTGVTAPLDLGVLSPAMETSPTTWRWWVRSHPTMSDAELSRALALLPTGRVSRADVEWVTELPLPALLRHTDVHVTVDSTVVLEAKAFGVPSVVLSVDAPHYHPQLAASGWIALARNPEELQRKITEQRERARSLPRPDLEMPAPRETLAKVLSPTTPR